MNQALFIYDDRITITNEINAIVNVASYGNIYYKNSTIAKSVQNIVEQFEDITFIRINNDKELEMLEKDFDIFQVIHFTANISILDIKNFLILLRKIRHLEENISLYIDDIGNNVKLFKQNSSKLFYKMIKNIDFSRPFFNTELENIDIDNKDILISLEHTTNFLYFFTGSFETRHFNSVEGNKYRLTKSSNDINKIEAEYNFYYHLPESFRFWFVQPFNFNKNNTSASYEMERYNIPNMALQWIHNSFMLQQFENFLYKYMTLIRQRKEKEVTQEIYIQYLHKNYLKKVEDRIIMLKSLEEYNEINMLISSLTNYDGIDSIINEYKVNFDMAEKELIKSKNNHILAITHGDPCFSNILYDKRNEILKLIDPKGTVVEDNLYSDPYYDVAKLSHSILGNYDYINNEIYNVDIDEYLKAKLIIKADFNKQNKEVFIRVLESNGLSPSIVRTFECSLFLSMLPLHKDRIRNVFAFILIAVDILNELKNNKEK